MKSITDRLLAIVLLIMVITPLDTWAQVTPIEIFQQGNNLRVRNRIGNAEVLPWEPYLNTEAKFTTIELEEGGTLEGFYRYNVETESLENANSEEVITPGKIRSFQMKNGDQSVESFVNMKVVWPTSDYTGFLQQINGSNKVLVKYTLVFKPKDYDPVMDMGNPYDRVEMEKRTYFELYSEWYSVPETRNQLIDALEKYESKRDLKKFMRRNKVKVDDPESIYTLIDHITKSEN